MSIYDLYTTHVQSAVGRLLDEDEDLQRDEIEQPVLELAYSVDMALYEWRAACALGKSAEEILEAAVAVSETVVAFEVGLPTETPLDDDDDWSLELEGLGEFARVVAGLVIAEGVPVTRAVMEIFTGILLTPQDLGVSDRSGDPRANTDLIYMRGIEHTRAQYAAAPIPANPMTADQARAALATEIAHPDRDPPGEALCVAITAGTGKSGAGQFVARARTKLPVAYVARDHRLTRQVRADMAAPGLLPPRASTRRMGILAPRGDQDDTALCSRAEEARAILEAGGSPARLLCPSCKFAPPHGGDCEAYGGAEGSARDTLITVPQLAPVVSQWALEQVTALVIVDEPPPVVETTTVGARAITDAIVLLRAARAGTAPARPLPRKGRRHRREARARENGKPYSLRGPLVEPMVATAALPALVLAQRLLEITQETDVQIGPDPTSVCLDPSPPPVPHTSTMLEVAARDLLRASADPHWAARQSVATTWVEDLRSVWTPVAGPEAGTDWESLDPTYYVALASRALAMVAPGPAPSDAPTVGLDEGLSETSRSMLAGTSEAPRALEALRALTTARSLARWLAPVEGLPAGVARVAARALVITAPSQRAVELLSTCGHLVVLDATPDRVGLEAAARWAGRTTRWLTLDVEDGADVAREMIYASAAAKSSLMSGGAVSWDALGSLLVHALARVERADVRTVLLITHLAVAEVLRPILHRTRPSFGAVEHPRAREALRAWFARGDRRIAVGHYHAIRGANEFRWAKGESIPWRALDVVITIGDPYSVLDHARDEGVLLGLALPLGRARMLAADELAQAHGRLRPPIRSRPGVSVHLGQVVPTGWHRENSTLIELERGPPRDRSDMTLDELCGLVRAHGSAGALARAAMIPASTISRYLSGRRALTSATAVRLRAAPRPPAPLASVPAPATDSATPPAPPEPLLRAEPAAAWAPPPPPLPADDDDARAVLRARLARLETIQSVRDAGLAAAIQVVTDALEHVEIAARWQDGVAMVPPPWGPADAERAAALLGGVPPSALRHAMETWAARG